MQSTNILESEHKKDLTIFLYRPLDDVCSLGQEVIITLRIFVWKV